MKNSKKIIHLDCTLRDGGYYTNWDFSDSFINEYLEVLSHSSVDICEIGFRTLKNEGFKGALAFCSDIFLDSLTIPNNIKICVMINASELINKKNATEILKTLFPREAANSYIKIVRIACHYHEIFDILPLTFWLREKGYEVGINLMQISEVNNERLRILLSKLNNFPLSVFYFADSLGAMSNNNTEEITKIIYQECNIPFGCHLHDNLGLALSNTLICIKNGASWVDSTISGMGRGPGNCKTEELLIEKKFLLHENSYDISSLLDLINKYFTNLKSIHKWGSNPYYYLAGKYKIHPTYIQTLLSEPIYSDDDRIILINKLKNKKANTFNPNLLTEGLTDFTYSNGEIGTWNPMEIFKNKEVLILATGPSSTKYKKAISMYIKKSQPIVIGLNIPSPISSDLINIKAACHPIRMMKDLNLYAGMDQFLMCPYSKLDENLSNRINQSRIFDYGLVTKEKTFEFHEKYCVIPKPLVLFYAIAAAISGKSKSISIAGIDGYPIGDSRNKVLESLFDQLISEIPKSIKLNTLTPSCLKNINQKSIFS